PGQRRDPGTLRSVLGACPGSPPWSAPPAGWPPEPSGKPPAMTAIDTIDGILRTEVLRTIRTTAQLDIQFGALYFSAVRSALMGVSCPGCWAAMFAGRENVRIARIQFALAGMNAHINRDLCLAIEATCKVTGTLPQHGTAQ